MASLQERSEIERNEAIAGRKVNTREYLIFPAYFMLQTVRQTERNELSLSEFKVISMVVSIKTSSIQTMEKKLQENGENLVLTAEMLLPPAMISCFLRVLLSDSAISCDGLFTYESGCFLSTDFRSTGAFLGVFSSTKQNFVGTDPGFKLIREEPEIFLKQSASKC